MSNITGTSGPDVLNGSGGDDSMDGLPGNDLLQGGAGNDYIDGGSGVDTAVFSGNLEDYEFSFNDSGVYFIRDRVASRNGLDELINVEFFQFADQTISGAPSRPLLSFSVQASLAPFGGLPYSGAISIGEGSYNPAAGPMPTSEIIYTIFLSSPAPTTTRINWQVLADDTNTADFGGIGGTIPAGQVTIPAGQTAGSFSVFVNKDLLVEFDEEFRVILTGAEINAGSPSQALAILDGQVENFVQIYNDDTRLTVSPSPQSALEGDSFGAFLSYSVFLDGYDPGYFLFDWRVVPSDLTGGITSDPTKIVNAQDFSGGVLPSGQGLIGNSQAYLIGFPVAGDLTPELDESFVIELTNGRLSTSGPTSPVYFSVAPPPGGFLGPNVAATGTLINDDAKFVISPANVALREGTGANTTFNYSVARPSQVAGALEVNWVVVPVGNSPASGSDFVGGALPSGTLSFSANQGLAQIQFAVLGDRTVELDESFQVRLVNEIPPNDSPTLIPPAATTFDVFANGQIINDDVPLGVSITGQSAPLAEGNSGSRSDSFTVTRTGDLLPSITVNWAVQPTGLGNAPVDAADFAGGALPSGTLVIGANQRTGTVSVPIQGDLLAESDETYQVTLSSATSSDREPVIIGLGTTATILNDDSTLLVTPDNASRPEGTRSDSIFGFTINRSALPVGTASVNWAVDFRQTDAADFVGPTSGTITLADGEVGRRIQVTVLGDSDFEADEAFAIVLSNALASDGVTPMPVGSPAITTILNDDRGSAVLSIAGTRTGLVEGNSGSRDDLFTVTRSVNLGLAVSANWSVRPAGTGTEQVDGSDFRDGTLPQGTVLFAADQTTATISVPIRGDILDEANERYEVVLSNLVSIDGPATVGTGVAAGSILNDDSRGFRITSTTVQGREGSAGESTLLFTATRGGSVDTVGATLDWQVSGGTLSAFDFADGTVPSGQLVFQPGQASRTFTLTLRDDSVPELDERIGLTFPNATIGGLPATTQFDGEMPQVADNDVEYRLIGQTSTRAEGNAGITPFGFLVSRSGSPLEAASLSWQILPITASASDFAGALTGTATFIAGQRDAEIIVTVRADTEVEPTEWFLLSVNAPGAASSLTSLGTILNDDGATANAVQLVGTATAGLDLA